MDKHPYGMPAARLSLKNNGLSQSVLNVSHGVSASEYSCIMSFHLNGFLLDMKYRVPIFLQPFENTHFSSSVVEKSKDDLIILSLYVICSFVICSFVSCI